MLGTWDAGGKGGRAAVGQADQPWGDAAGPRLGAGVFYFSSLSFFGGVQSETLDLTTDTHWETISCSRMVQNSTSCLCAFLLGAIVPLSSSFPPKP